MMAIWCDSRNFHRFTSAKVPAFPSEVHGHNFIWRRKECMPFHFFTIFGSLYGGGSLRDFVTRKDTKIFMLFSA